MKLILSILIIVTSWLQVSAQQETPEQLINRQLEAYNNRNINDFLATYSDSIKIYNHPNDLIMNGKEDMRKVYATMFERTPDLNCEIKNRIIQGNKIIDQEHVTGFPDGRSIKAIAIYEVKDGLIYRVHFVR